MPTRRSASEQPLFGVHPGHRGSCGISEGRVLGEPELPESESRTSRPGRWPRGLVASRRGCAPPPGDAASVRKISEAEAFGHPLEARAAPVSRHIAEPYPAPRLAGLCGHPVRSPLSQCLAARVCAVERRLPTSAEGSSAQQQLSASCPWAVKWARRPADAPSH